MTLDNERWMGQIFQGGHLACGEKDKTIHAKECEKKILFVVVKGTRVKFESHQTNHMLLLCRAALFFFCCLKLSIVKNRIQSSVCQRNPVKNKTTTYFFLDVANLSANSCLFTHTVVLKYEHSLCYRPPSLLFHWELCSVLAVFATNFWEKNIFSC